MRYRAFFLHALAAGAGSLIVSTSISAAEVFEHQDTVVVRGNLEVNDLRQFDLSKKRKIIFEHSLGGNYAAALYYIEKIKANDLDSVVKGKCFSACAIAFLSGKKRTADTGGGTISAISFHSARVKKNGTEREYDKNDELVKRISELTDGKMSKEVLQLIRSSWTEASGVIFVSYPSIIFSRRKTLYCDGTHGTDSSKCKELADADALDMGVLTRD